MAHDASPSPEPPAPAMTAWERNLLNEIRRLIYPSLRGNRAPQTSSDAGKMVGHNLEFAMWLSEGDAKDKTEAARLHGEATQLLRHAIGPIPIDKRREFLRGIGEALCHSPTTDGSDFVSTTVRTNTYLLLYAHREEVKHMKTVKECHQWVIEELGKSAAGSLKSFAKLCLRLKLKFKPPGRPRKDSGN